MAKIKPLNTNRPTYAISIGDLYYQVLLEKTNSQLNQLNITSECFSLTIRKTIQDTWVVRKVLEFHYRTNHDIKLVFTSGLEAAKRLSNLHGQRIIVVDHSETQLYAVVVTN